MIIESKKFLNILSKINGFKVNGFEFLPFVSIVDNKENKVLINHERIHIYQQLETLIIGYWIIYLLNYLYNICTKKHKEAYKAILFEKEAYANHGNLEYLKTRKLYAWLRSG